MSYSVGVFAKFPQAGRVKTRLAPLLGDEHCAQLASYLLLTMLNKLLTLAADRWTIHLWTDGGTEQAWDKLLSALGASAHRVQQHTQVQGHLGVRMAHALSQQLKHSEAAVLVGPDAVALQPVDLAQLVQDSINHPMGFIPAWDGGYVAVLARTLLAEAFDDSIDWGSAKVADQTRQRLKASGQSAHWSSAQPDLDEPADYEQALRNGHLPADWRCVWDRK